MLLAVLEWSCVVVGLAMVLGTLIGFSNHPHWFVRGWDFPRLQIILLLLLGGVPYALFFHDGGGWGWAYLAAVAATAAWQAARIAPYTPLWPPSVQRSRRGPGPRSIRVMVSNVRMENHDFARWRRVVEAQAPDVVLAVEIDDWWMGQLDSLRDRYPHVVAHPQDNWYGMALLSALPLVEPRVEFLVQDDVPSIHSWIELPSGDRVMLHGLHPRPPEPKRDQDAAPRDAELVIVGRRIGGEHDRPTIVAGDLNDVAWSRTTSLFLRLSGMLDPRRGRGLFNSFNANSWFWRFPLDHVFHTNEFRLIDLRLLGHVGSDHFPVCIELSLEPDAEAAQPEPEPTPHDQDEADDRLEREAEEARTGRDRHAASRFDKR